jgi:hypothetical protein
MISSAVVIVVLFSAYILFMTTSSKTLEWTDGFLFSNYVKPTPSPTPEPTPTPKPTPAPTLSADPSATIDPSAEPTPELTLWERESPKYAGIDLTKILFIGDSVSHGLDVYQILPGANVIANVGMSSYNLVDHLAQIKEINPERIFILLGLNDMSGNYQYDAYISNYSNFIREVQKELPGTKIYVEAMFAVTQNVDDTNGNVTNDIIKTFNAQLLKMANQLNVPFIDLRSIFQDENGLMRQDISPDGIHFYLESYYTWTEKLIPYMK